jgi:uncharacterized membrane protein YhiD involved in acid resistance
MAQWVNRTASWLERRPFTLLVLLYLAIGVLAVLAFLVPSGPLHDALYFLTRGNGLGGISRQGAEVGATPDERHLMWMIGPVAMFSAGMLVLPLAWVYTITRQKRGYRQSMVHSLILLPVIVAGVVVLVKFSLALAFSVAGIVAAVRFRHTLEDSKDAVYIFAATGIGLASGVELGAAAALSIVFNLVTLLLFRTDFGRTPGRLEGDKAEERMRRALALANRTSQFVARLDREVLEDMAPEQLEALADRAWRHRQESAPGLADQEEVRFDSVLTVHTDGATAAREAVEAALDRLAKRWRFRRGQPAADGEQVLEYAIKLKKSIAPTAFLDAVRAEVAAGVRSVELT